MEGTTIQRGISVDFAVSDGKATEIYYALETTQRQLNHGALPGMRRDEKSKTTAALFAIFLGWLGVHKFYLGNTGAGVVYLLCGTIGWITVGILPFIIVVISVVEGIIYLSKSDRDWEARYGGADYPNPALRGSRFNRADENLLTRAERHEPQLDAIASSADADGPEAGAGADAIEAGADADAFSRPPRSAAPTVATPPVGSALRNRAGIIIAIGGVALIVGGIFAFLIFVEPAILRWPVVVMAGAVFFAFGWFLVASARYFGWALSYSSFPISITIFGAALAGLTVYGVSLYGASADGHSATLSDVLDVNYLIVAGVLLTAAACATAAARLYGESRSPASETGEAEVEPRDDGRSRGFELFAYAGIGPRDNTHGLRQGFWWQIASLGTMGAATLVMLVWVVYPKPELWWVFNLVWFIGLLTVAAISRSLSLSIVTIALFYIAVVARLIDLDLFEKDIRLLAPAGLILAVLVFVGGRLQSRFEETPAYARVVDMTGLAMALGVVYLMSYRVVWKSPDIPGVTIGDTSGYWLMVAIPWCIPAALMIISLVKGKDRYLSQLQWEIGATALMGVTSILVGFGIIFTSISTWWVMVLLLNGILLAAVAGLVAAGFRWNRTDLINLSIVIFAVAVPTRYFEYLSDLLTGNLDTAVAVIVTGVILVLTGLALEFLRRKMLVMLRTGQADLDSSG